MVAIGELHLQGIQTPSHKLPQVLFLHFLKSYFAYLLPTLIAPGIYTHTHFALSKKTPCTSFIYPLVFIPTH